MTCMSYGRILQYKNVYDSINIESNSFWYGKRKTNDYLFVYMFRMSSNIIQGCDKSFFFHIS